MRAIQYPMVARYLHDLAAFAAMFMVGFSYVTRFPDIPTVRYQSTSLAITGLLVLGAALTNGAFRRMYNGAADQAVLTLITKVVAARESETSRSDPFFVSSRPPWPAIPPMQIVAMAAVAVALVVSIQSDVALTTVPAALSFANSTKGGAAGSEQGGAAGNGGAEKGGTVSGKNMNDGNAGWSDWGLWPAVGVIALGEIMYVGWIMEGEAVADDLVIMSRRWQRRLDACRPPPDKASPDGNVAAFDNASLAPPVSVSSSPTESAPQTPTIAMSRGTAPDNRPLTDPRMPEPPTDRALLCVELLRSYGIEFLSAAPDRTVRSA